MIFGVATKRFIYHQAVNKCTMASIVQNIKNQMMTSISVSTAVKHAVCLRGYKGEANGPLMLRLVAHSKELLSQTPDDARISKKVATRLNKFKNPLESYSDVVGRLLDEHGQAIAVTEQ